MKLLKNKKVAVFLTNNIFRLFVYKNRKNRRDIYIRLFGITLLSITFCSMSCKGGLIDIYIGGNSWHISILENFFYISYINLRSYKQKRINFSIIGLFFEVII